MGNSCTRSTGTTKGTRHRSTTRNRKRHSLKDRAGSPSTDSVASDGSSPSFGGSSRVIDARWGEPEKIEDSICDQFLPNPFKHGWCRNCQRQHDVQDGGGIVSSRVSKKISRPATTTGMCLPHSSPPIVTSNVDATVDLAQKLKDRQKTIQSLQQAALDRKKILDQVTERDQLRNAMLNYDIHHAEKAKVKIASNVQKVKKELQIDENCPSKDEWL